METHTHTDSSATSVDKVNERSIPSAMKSDQQLGVDTTSVQDAAEDKFESGTDPARLSSLPHDLLSATVFDRVRDTFFQYKIWAPMIYALVYIYYFSPDTETLDVKFLFTLCVIFVLAGIADYVRDKNASLRHELTSHHRLLENQMTVITALAASLENSRQDVVRVESVCSETTTERDAIARALKETSEQLTAATSSGQKALEELNDMATTLKKTTEDLEETGTTCNSTQESEAKR